MQNWQDTLIRQYANSQRMLRIIEDFNDNIDSSAFFELFIDNIWNPNTAVGYGLDVWGRIVGVSRYLKVSSAKFFGWADDELTEDTFDNSIFYNGNDFSTTYRLTDDMYRSLIFAKAWANLSDCSVKSINGCLMMLFGDSGNVYLADQTSKSMKVVFTFTPSAMQASIVANSGVIPRPAGVPISYEIVTS